MARRLKIVIAGYAVGFPLGGQIWMMLHYMLGFSRMGHEVLFLEDSSDWAYPYDPKRGVSDTDSTYGRELLERFFSGFGLSGRWAYFSGFENRLYGWDRERLDCYIEEADLFLNISGVLPLREEYLKTRIKAVIDTDPVFMQIKISNDDWTYDYYKAHDVCFTYGYNLPAGKTEVPLSGIDWKPLLPPVVLSEWLPLETTGTAYTTVGSWDAKGRDVELGGHMYSWRKSIKYGPLIDLPGHMPGLTFDLTFSGMDSESGLRFARHGWVVRDAGLLSQNPWRYNDYIRNSRAEFTVAKDQNVMLKSGWFSDRSACYLAAGRPVITEDTGFTRYLPAGEGLFAFTTQQEIREAISAIEAEPERHRAAARAIAREYFDAEKQLTHILKETGLA
jgi:hypothetical protein